MPKKTSGKLRRKDKYYYLARETGYRARSAFKLIQINKRFYLLESARCLVDLCAAPGGWLQVAARHMPQGSTIVGMDLMPIKPIRNVIAHQEDITTPRARYLLKKDLGGAMADVVLHDGAPNVGADWAKDAYSQSELVIYSLGLAVDILRRGGAFVTKVFRSSDYHAILWVLNKLFRRVDATKPHSSRNVSAEIFVVCRGYIKPDKIDPRLLDPKHVFKMVEEATDDPTARPGGIDDAPASDGTAAEGGAGAGGSKKKRHELPLSVTAAKVAALREHSEKRSSRRKGYTDNDAALVRRPVAVSDFLFERDVDPVELLAGATELTFGAAPRYGSELAATRARAGASAAEKDRAEQNKAALESKMKKEQGLGKQVASLPCTTEEVRACCRDLRVLGPREFRTLLRWREAARKQSGWDAAMGRFRGDDEVSGSEEDSDEDSDASGASDGEEKVEGSGEEEDGDSDEDEGDELALGLAKEAKAEMKKKKRLLEKTRLRAMRRRALNAKVDSTSIDWQEDEGVLSVIKLREMVQEERKAKEAARKNANKKGSIDAEGQDNNDEDDDDDILAGRGAGADGKLPEHMKKAEAALRYASGAMRAEGMDSEDEYEAYAGLGGKAIPGGKLALKLSAQNVGLSGRIAGDMSEDDEDDEEGGEDAYTRKLARDLDQTYSEKLVRANKGKEAREAAILAGVDPTTGARLKRKERLQMQARVAEAKKLVALDAEHQRYLELLQRAGKPKTSKHDVKGEEGFEGTSGPVHTGGSDSDDSSDDEDEDEYEAKPASGGSRQKRMDALGSTGPLRLGGDDDDDDDEDGVGKATEGQANRWFASRPLLASISTGAMLDDDADEDEEGASDASDASEDAPKSGRKAATAGRKRGRSSMSQPQQTSRDGKVVDFEASSKAKKKRRLEREDSSDSDAEDPLAGLPLSDREKRKQRLRRNRERSERKVEKQKKKLDREIEVAAASMSNGRPQEKSGPVPVAEGVDTELGDDFYDAPATEPTSKASSAAATAEEPISSVVPSENEKDDARKKLIRKGFGSSGSVEAASSGKKKWTHDDSGSSSEEDSDDSDDSDSDEDESEEDEEEGGANGYAKESDPRFDEDYDSDTHATILALAKKMRKHTAAKDLVDASYNRYSTHEDPNDLPAWFVDDERKHFRPQLPITREDVDEIKRKFREISARPIHKVAEARARKRHKQVQAYTKARKAADGIMQSEELTDTAKMKAVQRLYSKAGGKIKRPQAVYVVASKGGTSNDRSGVARGAKVKVVDKRMKSDMRGLKRAEKRRKGPRRR